MLKKIASGYGKLFFSIGKILLLAVLCIGLSFIIVYPLWKWALSSPNSYSLTILVLFFVLVIYWMIKKIKTQGALDFLKGLSKVLIIIGGISGCVISVLNSKRILALVIFVATFVIYGILAYGFKDDNKTSNKKSEAKNDKSISVKELES